MNKLKLLYEVITTMKKKEIIKGCVKVEGTKDQVSVFSMVNEFEKNMAEGSTKAKISTEMNHGGSKIKNESIIESDGSSLPKHMLHGPMGPMHFHRHGHFENSGEGCEPRHFSLKGKLNKLAFMFGILNNMKVDELEDKNIVLSLDLNDIPDDIKESMHEHMNAANKIHQHDGFMKEFHDMDNPEFEVKVLINSNNEVEKVQINSKGKSKDEKKEEHNMNFEAELNLAW
ncbi:MAG: hypothetical protein Q8920_05155 [Bacillota bacterium]|nr:hypothetical protein [Bacillota bacterium]